MPGTSRFRLFRPEPSKHRRLPSLVGAVALLGLVLQGASTAAAAAPAMAAAVAFPCSGSLPGGTYAAVNVVGTCKVNAGPVVVTGAVTVSTDSNLLAAYALNDHTGHGTSSLTAGSISVASGGTVLLGCEAAHFACIDDPHPSAPTLNGPPETVKGSITAANPLGIILHVTTVLGNVVQTGGGGGVTCTPTGVFAQFGSPVYSDYEDDTVDGYLSLTGIKSCWLGGLRDKFGGSVTMDNNVMADPDSMEILSNTIAGNLICYGNSPANQYGDSGGSADVVSGFAVGQCAFSTRAPRPAPHGTPTPIAVPSATPSGYWLGAADGGVFSFGAPFDGSASGSVPSGTSAVGIAATPGGKGYCLTAGAGETFSYGTHSEGCATLPFTPNKPVVGIAALPNGGGSYLVAADGGIFTSGTAPFYGSTGALTLNKPVVGMATGPFGTGYWLVAADGGVFTFGPGVKFFGSTGNLKLAQPVVGMALDPATGGYWLVAKDGGVFSFNAPFYGSLGGIHLNAPIVGIAPAPTGTGYYLVGADGGVFTFGPGSHFQGSTGSLKLAKPVVGMALG